MWLRYLVGIGLFIVSLAPLGWAESFRVGPVYTDERGRFQWSLIYLPESPSQPLISIFSSMGILWPLPTTSSRFAIGAKAWR